MKEARILNDYVVLLGVSKETTTSTGLVISNQQELQEIERGTIFITTGDFEEGKTVLYKTKNIARYVSEHVTYIFVPKNDILAII